MKNHESILELSAHPLIPVVHMNGSSKKSLVSQWTQFRNDLENAAANFPHESCHGRNHYVKGEIDDPCPQVAMREAAIRVQKAIEELIDCSQEVLEKVNEQ